MSDHFIDGIRLDANRSNEASGRSWHIPADDREPSKSGVTVAIFAAVIVAACLIGAVL